MRTQQELESFASLSWRLLKDFLDVPMVVDIVGEELAHIAEPYVDRNMLSEHAPSFRLVSGFGASSESRAQQLLNLVQTSDPMGQPLLTAQQLRQKWPDQNLFSEQDDPQEYRTRHARVVNKTIERCAEMMRQSYPQLPQEMNHPMLIQAASMCWQEVDHRHPLLMDDDLQAHIGTLSLLTQDDTQDPLVRHTAMLRQDQYWQWMAQQMAAQQAPAEGGGEPEQVEPPRASGPQLGIPATTGERRSAGAESMMQQDRDFEQRARQVRSA